MANIARKDSYHWYYSYVGSNDSLEGVVVDWQNRTVTVPAGFTEAQKKAYEDRFLAPRTPFRGDRTAYLHQWLGKIHERYGTPTRAIALSTVVYCLLAKFDVEDMVNIYIWTRIATTLLTLFAAWQMRRKMPDAPRSFRIPGGALGIAYILIFPLVLCVLKIAQSEDYVWRYAPLLLASGPVAYVVLRYAFKLRPPANISATRT